MAESLRIVLTGANRGLGLEFARHYLETGHALVASCRDPERAGDLRALVDRHRDRARLVRCDVADPESVRALADAVPWEGVDLLINNAGVGGGRETTLADVDFDLMRTTFDVNTLGPLRTTRALWPKLVQAKGKILHVSSMMGSIADNESGGSYAYRASKAALNMVVRSLGIEARQQGVVTFAIHPGWVRTDMGGGQAPLSIEESVSAMIATLAAAGSDWNGTFVDRHGERLPW